MPTTLFLIRRGQVLKYGEKVKKAGKQAGLRLNPECSTQKGHAIYDPCAPGSRMGTTLSMLSEAGNFGRNYPSVSEWISYAYALRAEFR